MAAAAPSSKPIDGPAQPGPRSAAASPHSHAKREASGSLDSYLQTIAMRMQNRSYAAITGHLDEDVEALSIVDEPNVDLSVPAPGTGDTWSNASPYEFR